MKKRLVPGVFLAIGAAVALALWLMRPCLMGRRSARAGADHRRVVRASGGRRPLEGVAHSVRTGTRWWKREDRAALRLRSRAERHRRDGLYHSDRYHRSRRRRADCAGTDRCGTDARLPSQGRRGRGARAGPDDGRRVRRGRVGARQQPAVFIRDEGVIGGDEQAVRAVLDVIRRDARSAAEHPVLSTLWRRVADDADVVLVPWCRRRGGPRLAAWPPNIRSGAGPHRRSRDRSKGRYTARPHRRGSTSRQPGRPFVGGCCSGCPRCSRTAASDRAHRARALLRRLSLRANGAEIVLHAVAEADEILPLMEVAGALWRTQEAAHGQPSRPSSAPDESVRPSASQGAQDQAPPPAAR